RSREVYGGSRESIHLSRVKPHVLVEIRDTTADRCHNRVRTDRVEALLARYGYLILFPGIVLEGEAFLLAGSFMAHRGVFDLPAVIAIAVAATMLGDHVYYHAARARGREWLERRRGSRITYAKWIDLAQRRGIWLLLASRWAYGLRVVIPAACGAV